MAHIDTYVSPTSWTDLGMDWENPNSQKACYVDALLMAFLERSNAVNYVAYYAYPDKPSPDRKLSYSNLQLLHTHIIRLIPYFIDSDDLTSTEIGKIEETYDETEYQSDYSYGNVFTNRTETSVILPTNSSFPYYRCCNFLTVQKVAEKLGLSEIISPEPYAYDNSLWIKQSYNILNLLKCNAEQAAIQGAKKRTRLKYTDYINPENSSDTIGDWATYDASRIATNAQISFDGETETSLHQKSDEGVVPIYLFKPTSWRIIGYIHKFNPGATYFLRFDSPEVDCGGLYFYEYTDTFSEGLRTYNLTFGNTANLVAKPSAAEPYIGLAGVVHDCSPYLQFGRPIYMFVLIEHDFKFKAT